jgi:hypothetical protein
MASLGALRVFGCGSIRESKQLLLQFGRDIHLVRVACLTRGTCALSSSCPLADGVGLLSARTDEDALGGRLTSTAGSTSLVVNSGATIRVGIINYKSAISISARLIKFNSLPSILSSLRSVCGCFIARRLSLGLVAASLDGALDLVLSEA